MRHYRIGIDTGGTFTDVTLVNDEDGSRAVTKVPSTPDNPARAVMNGVNKIIAQEKIDARHIQLFLHGTTVATNTLLEKKGAKVALMTTEGFRDVLEIGRQTRPRLYDFRTRRPEPLVPRKYRLEIPERVRHTGHVLQPLDESAVQLVLDHIAHLEVEVVAVSLLNSYANPTHEQRLKQLLNERFPELFVSLSSEVLPEVKEYERTSTVVANAYVIPVMDRYLSDLERRIEAAGIPSELYIMQSNGGVIAAEEARRVAARTTLSGPVGGVMAGSEVGRDTGHDHVITLDMGGTSLDICLIEAGEPDTTTEAVVAGYPMKLPMLDIHTIGAGGGSLAWIDAGGALRVGPRSAGAVPGPVCYGKGGKQPTVTDAHAILGRLNPDGILGGEMALDIETARDAMREQIAEPLDLSVEEAALGVLQVVNTNMMRGIRVVSVERGRDPRDFAMVGFGGAGPLHVSELAHLLGVSEVIVPVSPGIASAVGMIMSDVRHDDVRAYFERAEKADLGRLKTLLDEMEKSLRGTLTREGFAQSEQEISYWADFRYQHQSYDISVPLAEKALHPDQWHEAVARFHREHERLYGYHRDEEPVEVVHVRVTAKGRLPRAGRITWPERMGGKPRPFQKRPVYWEEGWQETPIYKRAELRAGDILSGPAILEQLDSTVAILPGQTATIDSYGNCRLTFVKGGRHREN